MYYNKITGKLVIDSVDVFLMSAFIASKMASHLKEYLSEASKMKRLKDDIIEKSRVTEPSQLTNSNYSKEIQKIYNFALYRRGGQIEEAELIYKFSREFQLAQHIKKMIIRTVIFLKAKEQNAQVLKNLFLATRLGIQFILIRCNIQIECLVVDKITKQVIVISMCSGGTLGFIHGWFAAGALLIGTPTLLSAFIIRSLAQQYVHHRQHQEIL